MCNIGRNPCRTAVRMLSGMLGGQEAAFGVKFTCSRGMAPGLRTAYAFWLPLRMGVRFSLCGYDTCSLYFSLLKKPWHLSADFDLLSLFLSRAANWMLHTRSPIFFPFCLNLWLYRPKEPWSLGLLNTMGEVTTFLCRPFFRNMSLLAYYIRLESYKN